VAKINGPFPTFTGLPATLDVDQGDPLVLDAEVLGAEPVSLQWYKDGEPIAGATSALFSVVQATAADAGEYYVEGTNAYGTLFSAVVVVRVRVPDRIVLVEVGSSSAENRLLETPVYLESGGDVTGITLVIPYNQDYLFNAGFVLDADFASGNSSVVVDKNAGTVRVLLNAFPSTIPVGRHLLGTFRATTRSVPEDASVSVSPALVSISDVFGQPLEGYTKIREATVSIAQRNVPGDANNNGRLDVADAAELIRLYGTPSLIRLWDNYLNDVNGDTILTEGDTIGVLRVAAGLDDMPVFADAAPVSRTAMTAMVASPVEAPASLVALPVSRQRSMTGLSSMRSFASMSVITPPSARLVLTRLTGSNANKVMAQIFVDGLPSGQAGLSFTVNYPAALLRIAGSQALVTPTGGLPAEATRIWNPEQTGTVTLAAANAFSFGFDPTKPVANIVFDLQPAATAQVHFPVTLTAVEASPFNAEGPASPVSLAGQTAVFSRTYADWASANLGDAAASSSSDSDGDGQSNGAEFAASTDPADALSLLRTTSMERGLGGFTVRWLAAYGVTYRLSASTDLKIWSPAGGIITGEGVETSATDSSSSSSARKFYRVEVVSP